MRTQPINRYISARDRFELRVSPEPMSGCWLWTGDVTTTGYGRMRIDGRATGAHRAAWYLLVGPIPQGLSVLHRCDNPVCVNPDHLFLGTHSDNMVDASTKGRLRNPLAEANRVKTSCPKGHAYAGDNLGVYASGHRYCRTCHRDRATKKLSAVPGPSSAERAA